MLDQSSIPSTKLFADYWPTSEKASEVKFDAKYDENMKTFIPELAIAIAQRKIDAAKLGNDNVKEHFKKLISEKDASFLETENQLQAARALIIAYSKLLGLPSDLINRLANNLLCSFKQFRNNPTLFTAQNTTANNFLQEIMRICLADEKKLDGIRPVSVAQMKAVAIVNRIELFSHQMLDREIRLPQVEQKSVELEEVRLYQFIPNQIQAFLEPYRESLILFQPPCEDHLDELKDKLKNKPAFRLCKENYNLIPHLLDQISNQSKKLDNELINLLKKLHKACITVKNCLISLTFGKCNLELPIPNEFPAKELEAIYRRSPESSLLGVSIFKTTTSAQGVKSDNPITEASKRMSMGAE